MKKLKYAVFDSAGMLLRYFDTWKQAETFKMSNGRMDWQTKEIWVS